ncbi:head GIN domain-containing protein [Wocania ichthyoenteri]|uniref:head GIN domain-containing protein n=1 Tax=Wocania ichthyoenteri TaxID=1230531 RepID=UPI00053EE60C|nr:head GIN domain-containing protein [Wocania ichthyoenteri]
MKRLVTILTIFISTLAIAQNPIEKSIGEFSELKVFDLIEVELIKSKENKVVISGNNANDVIVNNKNGKLKIKMNLEEIFDGNNTKVKLYYTGVEVIDVNEGAHVHSKDKIKQFEINLKAQEGGKIDVKLNVSYTNIKSVTGGVITTSGKSKNQKVSLLTGGVYKGEELKTDKTEVTIKAAGEAHVNASKLADIKIRAGGDAFIYGDPENVNESRVFGGRVKRMN